MSLTELKAEIEKLPPSDLEALRSTIEAELSKKQKSEPATFAEYAAALKGTIIFHDGWDDDEPLEQWNAERDDTPL
ncbi:MAG: hypothetical protein H0U23_14000 [Blastocatellia bacterium]|nr:hypothetical protein [Blastocatellia bacterium]